MTSQHPAGPPPAMHPNIRGWGQACGADAGTLESILARVRRTDR